MVVFIFLLVCFLSPVCFAVDSSTRTDDLDPNKFIVYGPGLYSTVVLPVRYVFIQLVDISGNNVTTSRGDKLIRANLVLRKDHSTPVRCFHDVQNLHDGSYVFRFRLIKSVVFEDIELVFKIASTNTNIGTSPYVILSPVYSEMCPCPMGTLPKYLKLLNCPANYSQITNDFKHFPSIDMEDVAARFAKYYTNPHAVAVCRYIIKNNLVYRKCFGEHVGFAMFSDQALLSMTRKTRLPDLDFLMNLGDWPLSDKAHGLNLPVVSWCGSKGTADIVIPSYEAMEWTLSMMSRLSLDCFTALNTRHLDWKSKQDVAFWRGRDSSQARLNLVKYSLAHPGDVDARLTAMFFFTNDSSLGEKSPHVSFHDFFRYRYQVNLDGTVAAYRLGLLLAGGSLVFKQASVYYEHFYSQLTPMEHYVPLNVDVKDLSEKLQWARKNPVKAETIGRRGREFVRSQLLPSDILCYYGRVLEALADRIVSPIIVPADFERIEVDEHSDPVEACECRSESLVDKNKPVNIRDEL